MEKINKNRLAFLASLDLKNYPIQKVIDIWIKYETGLHDCIRKHGKQYTLGRYKDCYAFLRNYLLELPTQPVRFCKVDRFGIPKPLWPLRPLIKRDRIHKRIALTIARGFEVIRLEIDYTNLASITDPLPGALQASVRSLNKKFRKFLKRFTKKRQWYLGSLQTPIQPWSKVLTTLSKGPNGPAVACAHLDAIAVKQDANLSTAIKELNIGLNQSWVTEWMEEQAAASLSDRPLYTGRLGFSAEPAGKTRIFAIGDYWSQLSLKPIQISLYRTLQSISTDSTSNQDLGFKSLVSESFGKPTYCFDLSSASDRIPAVMQKTRLSLMTNLHVADNWFKVMTERDFYVKALGQSVRWSVGQPLGLLSSFPSFALWHHDIVQFAGNWENYHKGKPLRFFTQYRLLGDDIVIFNTKVARRYQWLLRKVGLTINMTKSVIGDVRNSQIEFAKRLALRGKEMSSLRANILSKNDTLSVLDLVDLLHQRDFILPDTGHCGLHRILKSSDLQRLQVILWLRSSDTPQLIFRDKEGNVSLTVNREDLLERIESKRAAAIEEKAMNTESLNLDKELPRLIKGFKSIDVSCNEKTLAGRSLLEVSTSIMHSNECTARSYLSSSHPIVLGLLQTSQELQDIIMFLVLDDLDPDTVPPVEYLPVVSSDSYYHDRKTVGRYLSKIILDSFQEIIDENNS